MAADRAGVDTGRRKVVMTNSMATKRVSWVELFYDLVFVFAVTQIADIFAENVSWRGLVEA